MKPIECGQVSGDLPVSESQLGLRSSRATESRVELHSTFFLVRSIFLGLRSSSDTGGESPGKTMSRAME